MNAGSILKPCHSCRFVDSSAAETSPISATARRKSSIGFISSLRVVRGNLRCIGRRTGSDSMDVGAGREGGERLLLAQDQVHDPAAPDVRSLLPAVTEDVGVGATRFFQSVGKERRASRSVCPYGLARRHAATPWISSIRFGCLQNGLRLPSSSPGSGIPAIRSGSVQSSRPARSTPVFVA
jgi:hypothetical protein